MSKLRAGLLILVILAGSALLFSGSAQALQITYSGGDFYTEAAASVTTGGDSYDAGTATARGHDQAPSGGTTVEASREASANNDPVFPTNARGYGRAGYNIEYENSLTMFLEAGATGQPQLEGDSGSASGNANAGSTGIFFQLFPTEGYNENMGDPVQVTFQWFYAYAVTGGGTAKITGGNDNDVAITLNGDVVWTQDKLIIDHDVNFFDSTPIEGEFMAKVGDIIGVFLGVSSEMDFENTLNTTMTYCSTNLQIQANTPSEPPPVPLPSAILLLGSGILSLGIYRRWKLGFL